MLTGDLAGRFALLALSHVNREYPNKLDHVMLGASDVQSPRSLHPIFFGSFDWHSCVHGYWLLARVLRRFPSTAQSDDIRALFDERFTTKNVAIERSYASDAGRRGFERPYGWAWLLMLAAELEKLDTTDGHRWSHALRPLASLFLHRFVEFLPIATYPVRVGTHFNTAFAVSLALEYANSSASASATSADEAAAIARTEVVRRSELRTVLTESAKRWYLDDRNCQAWEPGGDDFMSSALMEAECMRRVLPKDRFDQWFTNFLPSISKREPAALFEPVIVSDRTDGKIAHLDGLNLSRAWCWRLLGSAFDESDARRSIALDAASRHLSAGIPHVSGDYSGEHWLATFAMLALDDHIDDHIDDGSAAESTRTGLADDFGRNS